MIRAVLFFYICAATAEFSWGQAAQSVPDGAKAADTQFAYPRQLMQQGKYDEAIAELQKLSSTKPTPKGLSRELGMAYYKKSDYAQSVVSFKRALEENSEDSEVTQLLGLSYYLAGRPAEAIPLLEKVQTWYPRANVDAAYILGQSHIQIKDYPHARQAFAKMFALPADSAASYF